VYEYCLSQFASLEGKNAGEFYTPSCIVRTLVEIIQPFHGRVYDPCCGSGGMFVQSAKFVESHGGNVVRDITVFGQESNANTWKLAKMNLGIRGIEADLGTYADTFTNDQHRNEKFDFILANPPFNMSNWGGEALREDVRWKYGAPPVGNANFAWMQHMIWHLNGRGRLGLVLANGSLSSQQSGEGDIRANIVKDDLVEGIVALPDKLFYGTGIPACLWIIDKDKKNRAEEAGKVLFVDARELGKMVTRRLRELQDDDVAKIAGAFDAFRKGELEEEKGFSAAASLDDIDKQDYILTPGRYVGIADEEDDGEPFDEKMKRLTGELSKCFEESNRLQEEIKKNLEAIGYGM
jgi:type I restriction enzyme M protein